MERARERSGGLRDGGVPYHGAVSVREEPPSPLDAALSRVGDRWSLLVIEALLAGPGRFNDLLANLPGIAPNVLSQRLKHLEREAVVVSHPYSQRPPRVSYELTAAGRDLAGALRLLAHWGSQRPEAADAPRHQSCGTVLEARLYCPTCARALSDDEGPDVRYV